VNGGTGGLVPEAELWVKRGVPMDARQISYRRPWFCRVASTTA
jgi:hypothetical protein